MTRESFVMAVSVLLILAIAAFIVPMVVALPTGGTFTFGTPETAPNATAGSNGAYAGNVTGVVITAFSTTQSWQGYFGNVTGTLRLADSGQNQMYNWSLADPEGEVYASTNSSIGWANIQCFNFTADGTFADETGNGGTTNLNGVNLTILQSRFNINDSDVDAVNNTFSLTIGGDGHNLFYTASQEFQDSECLHTKVFGDTGPADNEFEEVLLYEPTTGSVVFTAIIEPGVVAGFEGANADTDFELMVLEDGHGTDTSTTTYYFFVELE